MNRLAGRIHPLRIPFPYIIHISFVYGAFPHAPALESASYTIWELSIQLAHHHIDHAKQQNEVCNLVAKTHLFQRGDVDKRWSADVITPRIRLAVRDRVEA